MSITCKRTSSLLQLNQLSPRSRMLSLMHHSWCRGSSPMPALKDRVGTIPTFQPGSFVFCRAKRRQASNPVLQSWHRKTTSVCMTNPGEKPSLSNSWYIPSLTPTYIVTDASNTAVDAILQQCIGEDWSPIAFFSKMLQPSETRYSAFDYELLATYLATTEAGTTRHDSLFYTLLHGYFSMGYAIMSAVNSLLELTCQCLWCPELPQHQLTQQQEKPRLSFCCQDFSIEIEILASGKATSMR